MKGNGIIVTSNPKGMFLEGIISGTPKPGTVMQQQAGTALVGGRWTYEAYDKNANGDPAAVFVLLEDAEQGFTVSTAFVSGTRGRLYAPIMGEDLNMILADVSGTGDDHTIGERLQIQDGTGKLVTQGTPANRAPFTCNEATTDPVADYLAWCTYCGSAG